MPQMRSGELARKAGVSVRTLRFYDKVGLLKPSARSDSGQRLYGEADVARLQQILTLKLIGLSLDDIRHVLADEHADIARLIAQQKQALQTRVKQLTHVITTLEQAQARLDGSRVVHIDDFINIIKAVNTMTQANWHEQFLTEAQRATLAEQHSRWTLEEHKAYGEAWKALIEDIARSHEQTVRGAEAQTLVQRWDALVRQYTNGDEALADMLSQAAASVAQAAEGVGDESEGNEWALHLQSAARYIQMLREEAGS